MDFEATFPLRFWINLGRRTDRRSETEWQLEKAGLTAERFPAVDARFVREMSLERQKAATLSTSEITDEESSITPIPTNANLPSVRGYETAGRYALALTQRLAIRRARALGAEAVLLFEDDVVLHPNFRSLINGLELPEDWGICFLGCAHGEDPIPCAPGIVRVRYAVDTHAVAIRRPFYNRVIRALDAHNKPKPNHPLASDRFLAALEGEIPTYAFFPNLAWQATSESNLVNSTYSMYREGGTQKNGRELIDRTFARLAGIEPVVPGTFHPKLGLLFLTRGDVNHSKVWREFVEESPQSVRVFSHPKYPEALHSGFLHGTSIPEHFSTAWGSISLVRASLALLRRALEDSNLTHFVLLSESCIPILPLSEILRRLRTNPRSRFGWKTIDNCLHVHKARAAPIPGIPRACWHFTQQWWLLERIAAQWVARVDYTDTFSRMPIPDEAYFATVLSLLGYPVADRVVKQDITWAHWGKNQGSPTSFDTVNAETIASIVESGAWFARKFQPDSDVSKWGLHRYLNC